MRLNRFFAFMLAAITLLPALTCSAQEEERKKVEVKFLCFPPTKGNGDVELIASPKKTIEVMLPTRSPSKPYKVELLNRWVIGKSFINDEGDPDFEKYGEVKSIGAKKQLILAIRKGSKNEDGFDLYVMNSEEDAFSAGKYLIYNASNIGVAGKLGAKTIFNLKPGDRTVVAPKPNLGTSDKPLIGVQLYYDNNGEWKLFKATEWTFSDKVRVFLIFHQDPSSGKLTYKYSTDYSP